MGPTSPIVYHYSQYSSKRTIFGKGPKVLFLALIRCLDSYKYHRDYCADLSGLKMH